jgi:hypothetical protein
MVRIYNKTVARMAQLVGLCFGMLVRLFRGRQSPSLRSNRLVRIDFSRTLNMYALHAQTGSCSPKFSRCVEARSYSGLRYQERSRSWSRLKF